MSDALNSPARTKRTIVIAPLRPEFDKFLYASIGDSTDGMPTSVLSALARQNLDPWEEAAKLAQLSRESAISRLTGLISTETSGLPAVPASAAVAARLVALLPRTDRFSIPSLGKSGGELRDLAPIVICLIVGAIILASILFGY